MPWSKPYSRGIEIPVCTRQCNHGDLTVEAGQVGVAVKQKGYTIDVPRSQVTQISVGEQFFLITKGEIETAAIVGAALGGLVKINTTTGVVGLGAAGTGETSVGRITRLPGTYGMPATPSGSTGAYPAIPTHGLMAVDLDVKV